MKLGSRGKFAGATSGIAIVTAGALLGGPAAAGVVAAPALPASDTKTPLAISIGDSFISGEGGRFAGSLYDSRESDEAQDNGPHNAGRETYQDPWGGYDFKMEKNGDGEIVDSNQSCHRSDSAEIQATKNAYGWTPVNLACSGAVSGDVMTDWYHAEQAQVKQLAKLANDNRYDIKTVVVSIGGNDLGFSDLMAKLIQITDTNSPEDQPFSNKINPFVKKKTVWGGYAETIPDVKKKITNTLNSVSDTMRNAGYADGSYRFVYQSYSNLFAGSDNRYMAVDSPRQLKRLESPGVPLSNYTVDHSRSTMVPALTSMTYEAMKQASNKNIQYLDLTNAFNGHELSSKDTQQLLVKDGKTPRAATAEWVVPVNSNFIAGSIAKTSRHFESFHPNRFGQEAYGTCLVAALKSSARELVCVGQPGKPPSQLKISPAGGSLPGVFSGSIPQSNQWRGHYVPHS